MAKKYRTHSTFPILRVEEMSSVSATELKNSTADVFEMVASKQVVAIRRHDKFRAVLISLDAYKALTGREPDWLEDLKEEYVEVLERMQAPEQQAAALRAFNASPEELGEAAVRGAREKVASGEIKS